MTGRVRLALATAISIAACGRGSTRAEQRSARPAEGVSSNRPASPATAAASSPADSSCPTWGNWLPCSVEYRLMRAGLVVRRRPAPIEQPFLHIAGTVYDANDAEIQVYLYPDASSRARDTDALDSVAVAPRGGRVSWKAPATLVVSNNLAAIILSPNDRQAERIALALGAGMPLEPPSRR